MPWNPKCRFSAHNSLLRNLSTFVEIGCGERSPDSHQASFNSMSIAVHGTEVSTSPCAKFALSTIALSSLCAALFGRNGRAQRGAATPELRRATGASVCLCQAPSLETGQMRTLMLAQRCPTRRRPWRWTPEGSGDGPMSRPPGDHRPRPGGRFVGRWSRVDRSFKSKFQGVTPVKGAHMWQVLYLSWLRARGRRY